MHETWFLVELFLEFQLFWDKTTKSIEVGIIIDYHQFIDNLTIWYKI